MRVGTDLPPIYEPPRPADIRHSYASIQQAETILGYRPRTDVQDGAPRDGSLVQGARVLRPTAETPPPSGHGGRVGRPDSAALSRDQL